MSSLRVIVGSHLVAGFQLAGVEAYGVEDVEAATDLLTAWLDKDEPCLVALDGDFLACMEPSVVKRLNASDRMLYIAIPSGGASESAVTRSDRIARMIRHSIGVRIAFDNEEQWGDA